MIQAAIIGLGRWGRNLVESVQHSSNQIQFTLAVVQNLDKHRDFAQSKNLQLSDRFQDALEDLAIQLIVIATPHNLHIKQIVAAANAGKNVLCEKPLALSVQEAQIAIDACKAFGVQLGVGHDKRYWPSMQALQKVVLSGSLGNLIHIEGNFSNENSKIISSVWRNEPENIPGGSITATGIHIVDAFVNLMGPISKVQGKYIAHKNSKEFHDSMSLLCEFESGTTGVISSVRPTPLFWRIHIFGDLGSAEVNGQNMMNIYSQGKSVEVQQFEPLNALCFQLELMARSIENTEPYPMGEKQMINTVKAFVASAKALDEGIVIKTK